MVEGDEVMEVGGRPVNQMTRIQCVKALRGKRVLQEPQPLSGYIEEVANFLSREKHIESLNTKFTWRVCA